MHLSYGERTVCDKLFPCRPRSPDSICPTPVDILWQNQFGGVMLNAHGYTNGEAMTEQLSCNFCGRHKEKVRKLIAGPGVYICDECVLLCAAILRDESGDDLEAPADEKANETVGSRACAESEALTTEETVEFMRLSRPGSREECKDGLRPCPFVSCKYHLYVRVDASGDLVPNFPGMEVWEMPFTCILDVADAGGRTLEETALIMNGGNTPAEPLERSATLRLHTALWEEKEPGERKLDELHPDVLRSLYLPLHGFDVSLRVRYCLQDRNLQYVGELAQVTPAFLLRGVNVGKVTLREIRETLAGLGLHLGLDLPGFNPREVPAVLVVKPEETDPRLFEPVDRLRGMSHWNAPGLPAKYVGDLVKFTRKTLMSAHRVSSFVVKRIERELEGRGLSLGMAATEVGFDVENMLKADPNLVRRVEQAVSLCRQYGMSWEEAWSLPLGWEPPTNVDPEPYKPVELLGLSVRASNCLKNLNCKYLADVAVMTEGDLWARKNLGKKTLQEIKGVLASRGFVLDMQIRGYYPDRPYPRLRIAYARHYCEQFGWSWVKAWPRFPKEDELKSSDLELLLPLDAMELTSSTVRKLNKRGISVLGQLVKQYQEGLVSRDEIGLTHNYRLERHMRTTPLAEDPTRFDPNDVARIAAELEE